MDLVTLALAKKFVSSGAGSGTGEPGQDGKSAYEIAVENGFEGTEEEWLSSLQGEDGYSPTITENAENDDTTYKLDIVTKTGSVTTPNLMGKDGDRGEKGETGATPNLQIGEVITLNPGEAATATITGTPENPQINLGIPKGESSEGDSYTLPIMTSAQLGGGKAVEKTDEDVPVAVDPSTGQLFVPTYPESTGGSADIPRQEMQNTDTTVTLDPNKLYVFPEMTSLTVTLGTPSNTDIVNEWHWFFDSGETACVFSLQNQDGSQVYTDAYSIDANMRYEVSVLNSVAYIKGVAITADGE